MTISPTLFPAVTMTVVRDKKIRTTLRTNQIAGFVTVPSWKKINILFYVGPMLIAVFITEMFILQKYAYLFIHY